ncbi:class I SAM-dependent methyltransferase [Spirochaetota bacterium]
MLNSIKNIVYKILYRVYLWSTSENTEGIEISERIIEYPFALKHLITLPKGSKIAILGCHGDMLTSLLSELGYSVTGIDVKNFTYTHDNFTFIISDLRDMKDIESGYFNAVAAISTIEHVGLFDGDTDGDLKAVKEMRRILKPNGLFIITVPFAKNETVIELHERIYSNENIERLLKNITVVKKEAVSYNNGMWHKIPIEKVPVTEGKTTTCVCMVAAKKT